MGLMNVQIAFYHLNYTDLNVVQY